jgi:hypothetical protein
MGNKIKTVYFNKMTGCHHYDGSLCAKCDASINTCCGDDKNAKNVTMIFVIIVGKGNVHVVTDYLLPTQKF